MGDERDTEFRQHRRDFIGARPAPPSLGSPGWPGAIEGMQRAASHAEDVAPDWAQRATAKLRAFLAAHPDLEFIAPQVRKWAEDNGLDPPATNYAWGNVFRLASRAGLIARAGYRQFGDAVMHTQSVQIWRHGQKS